MGYKETEQRREGSRELKQAEGRDRGSKGLHGFEMYSGHCEQ